MQNVVLLFLTAVLKENLLEGRNSGKEESERNERRRERERENEVQNQHIIRITPTTNHEFEMRKDSKYSSISCLDYFLLSLFRFSSFF